MERHTYTRRRMHIVSLDPVWYKWTNLTQFLLRVKTSGKPHLVEKKFSMTTRRWIKPYYHNNSAATYAINYKSSLDGRNTWLSLARSFEREDARQLSISAARNTTSTTYFIHESMNFTFTDYCNKHVAANNALLLRGVPMDGISQVRAFIQGINLTQLMAVKSNVIMNPSTSMTYRRLYSFSWILH